MEFRPKNLVKALSIQNLTPEQISDSTLFGFNRHQEVTHCWRQTADGLVLKPVEFVETWSREDLARVATELKQTATSGGAVISATINDERIIGFASVERQAFGESLEYLQLSQLHVSGPFRGSGVGRELFTKAANAARDWGAAKLYISAHSSESSIAFYRALGCVDAKFINSALAELEPFDVQLEYDL